MRVREELQAGVFLLIGLVLIMASVFIIGKERSIFTEQYDFYAVFDDVAGLAEGAPVRLGGITVGRVKEINFSEDITDPKIHVVFSVSEDFLPRIRKDSTATIQSQGLLGDKYLSLSVGHDIQQLLPGAQIKAVPPADISEVISKASEIARDTSDIAEQVRLTLQDFRVTAFDDLKKSLKNVSEITKELKEGKGLLHNLIYSGEGGDIPKHLEKLSSELSKLAEAVNKKDGILHALVYKEEGKETIDAVMRAANDFSSSAKQLNILLTEINKGKGLLHEAIYGKVSKELTKTIEDLSETAANLRQASESLAEGRGTLGALLVDSSLYNQAVELLGGAKRSVLLRSAIRSALKKQERDRKR
ncbi:MAG: MCE family protein [Candidatus Dadabacteria bacterium]|nr:MAG: MCE family protein [Candidatus Dadabacteria bacterium]